jgi:hypothetical protein
LIVAFVGLAIAYLIPQVVGLVFKLQSGLAEVTPWSAAMNSIPTRIVHIIGLAITIVAAMMVFYFWSLRFTAPRDGES